MQKSIIASLLLLAATCAQAHNYTVKSPDGKLVVNVTCEEGKLSYTIGYDGRRMLTSSRLGWVANYGDFSQNLTIGTLRSGEISHLAYDMTRIKISLTLTLDLPMFAGQTAEYLTDLPKKKGEKFFTSVKKTLKVGKDGKEKVVIQPNGGIVID